MANSITPLPRLGTLHREILIFPKPGHNSPNCDVVFTNRSLREERCDVSVQLPVSAPIANVARQSESPE